MKLKQSKTLKEIAEFLECSFVGDPDHVISGLNEIHRVEAGDIVFVDHPKYYDKALKSNATTILIDKTVDCPEGKGLLVSQHPFDDFNRLTRHFRPTRFLTKTVGENPNIATSAQIYPNVIIGNDVTIGENVIIYPGVIIMDYTIIEDNVIIGANTVIGHN